MRYDVISGRVIPAHIVVGTMTSRAITLLKTLNNQYPWSVWVNAAMKNFMILNE